MKKILLPLLFVFAGGYAFGQAEPESSFDKMVDVLSPAPNATAIIRYGDASLNKNTGAASVSIPLFGLKGTKLGTSVSLGYSSQGIRVDDIASRAGMGWALNAGGVITRTVRGLADENNTRIAPSGAFAVNYNTWKFMYDVTRTADYNMSGNDAEPDLFNYSFDGAGGSFILDNSLNPVLIGQNAFKIEKNFASTVWNFKITTTEGIIYYFGGNTATETTKRLTTCGKAFNSYVPTSWYLKKIQHPNGEEINFNYSAIEYEYDNGVTQTMYYGTTMSPCPSPPIAPVTCTNLTKTKGVLLESISIPNSASITFNYTTRDDCNDKLLSSVYLKDPVNTVSYFDLAYTTETSSSAYDNEYRSGNNKTPYLTSIKEKSAATTTGKTHYFSYVDPAGRPSRLSFSQDHWGYFNGHVNTSFVPQLNDVIMQAEFPGALANREPAFSYAQKGLLKKIVYPTGGTSTFFYEPNTYNSESYYTTKHTLSCDVTGSGNWDMESKEKTFHLEIPQYVFLNINCRANGTIGFPHNEHVKGGVSIIDLSTNTTVYDREFLPTDIVDEVLPLASLGSRDYKIVIKSWGTLVTTLVALKYTPNPLLSAGTEKITGGIRVAKIATANPGEQPMIKKYFYGPLDDLHHSSLFYTTQPEYKSLLTSTTPCTAVPGGSQVIKYHLLNSASIINLGVYNNNQVSYPAVTESIGENFEGGGTESKFFIGYDVPGQVEWGKRIESAPLSNFSSVDNAKPASETIVKKSSGGDFVPLRKTVYTYQTDTSTDLTLYGYTITGPASEPFEPAPGCTPIPSGFLNCFSFLEFIMKSYNVTKYHIFSNRVNPATTTETLYDENGANPVVTTTNSYYANALHNQLTKTEVQNSKGQTKRTTFKYPHDYTGTGDYTAMVSSNIVSKVVDVKSELVTPPGTVTALTELKTNYANTGSYNYEPSSIEQSVKGGSFETEGTIELYDSKGNILQYIGKNEVRNAILWGYNYQYPVAKVTGATYAQAVAQLTGTMTALQALDGQPLRDELNHIRTGLPAAMVTTYTYKHLVGVSSITDANDKTNTYTYDEFNRLSVVKDQDGNVVKNNEYTYVTPSSSTGLTIYSNAAVSQAFTCQNCEPGMTGSTVTYAVPEGTYVSTVSQAVTDALAAADLSTNGQLYANMNGTCTNTATCTGPGYKFVSCACELGIKICESSVPGSGGTWINTVHYLWSDGSVSPTFLENMPACTGIDKKKIDCNCETGVKVCEDVSENSSGFTVNYHYHFSDNTNSATQTETFSCMGPGKKVVNCTCETGWKQYISSVLCKGSEAGCCPGKWLCTYRYRWSDGSYSENYTECSDETCILSED